MKKLILGISSLVAIGGLTTTLILTLGGKEPTPEPTPTPPVEVCVHEYNDATYTYSNDMLKVTGVAKCEKCKKEITETVNVNSYIITEATCTSDGLVNYVSDTFSNSLFTVQSKEVTTTSSGHNLVHHNAQSPTCTEKGWNEYDTCLYCDYSTYKEIDKLNHNYTITYTWNDDNTKVTATRTCSNNVAETVTETVNVSKEVLVFTSCGEKGTEKLFATFTKPYFETQSKIVDVDVLGHNLVTVEGKAPTCTETGLTDKIYCDRCNYVEQEATELEMVEHKHIWEGVIETNKCGETGCTGTEKCEYCGLVFTEPTYYTNTSEHSYIYIETKESNCKNGIGHTEGYACEFCGDILSGLEDIPVEKMNPFEYHINAVIETEIQEDATCTTNGLHYISGICSYCEETFGWGKFFIEETTPSLGHDYEYKNVVLATSLQEDAQKGYQECKRCKDKIIDESVDVSWLPYKIDSQNTPVSSTYTNFNNPLSYFIICQGNSLGQFGFYINDFTTLYSSNFLGVNNNLYTNKTPFKNGVVAKFIINLKDNTTKEFILMEEDIQKGLLFTNVTIDEVKEIDATFVYTNKKDNEQHAISYNFKVYNEEIIFEGKE